MIRAWAGYALVLFVTGACDRTSRSEPPASIHASSRNQAVERPSSTAPSAAVPSVPSSLPGESRGLLPRSFAPLVVKAKPAVVTVRAWIKRDNAFGRQVLDAQGIGTGFIYDSAGYILTNYHVIENASEIRVGFADRSELVARVVGKDKPTDVAVLHVDRKDLVSLPIGDSGKLQVGDWVVAIGNPFGLEYTVSAGILSAKSRTRDDVRGLDPTGYFNFLQTDASINPGNSGGPLLNLAGEVVGINAAVRANANNIGFAIPMGMVKQLLPMLLEHGRVRRSAIGLYVDAVSMDDAKRLGQRSPVGAKVIRVLAGKAGAKAGLAAGDVILAFNGRPVKTPNELRWLVSIAGVGQKVSLRLARGDRVFELHATLLALEDP